ncbi:DUF445 domain-containing protein [Jatrophihabitans telluris]|uniref:DUF445 domain-containing protein n=1 Tax=Jatrophihabitans telluris TaxID=2038343 RepID=A0ABY4R2P9_9ACTN|nr:DUF445 domain-containing protein [Jatrophihabitans telluris]UQX90183.1 DUF445 domain-containing protein [Jatrophihabitans telluris]
MSAPAMPQTNDLDADSAAVKIAALRRMKLLAAGGLVLAAIVFVVCSVLGDDHGAWPYVKATSEAAMVGGLADWFAVTALFRHPLGLPIPHTAIIPRKKDQIGASLGDFVSENFLTPEVVGPRVLAAQIPFRIGQFLAEPGRADKLAGELSALLVAADTVLSDADIRAAVETFAEAQLRRLPAAPVMARVLELAVEGNQHQILLGHGLHGLGRFLADNRDVFRQRVADESPDWVPEWVDERLFNKLFTSVQTFLADVADNPDHALRLQFDQQLRDYAVRLRTDPQAAAAVEGWKDEVLDHPAVRNALASLWLPLKQALFTAAADPDSELRRVVSSVIRQTGTALRDDPALRAKCDAWTLAMMGHVLAHYSGEITGVITHTVQRWDAESTSRRLELQVGRDLQFIRINGTVVGSIVGLAIYSIGRFL